MKKYPEMLGMLFRTIDRHFRLVTANPKLKEAYSFVASQICINFPGIAPYFYRELSFLYANG